jgi:hypothetical protein
MKSPTDPESSNAGTFCPLIVASRTYEFLRMSQLAIGVFLELLTCSVARQYSSWGFLGVFSFVFESDLVFLGRD